MKKPIASLSIALMFFVICTSNALAGAPLETVQTQVDSILDVLNDSRHDDESARDAKVKELRSSAISIFDFTELSMRTLGRDWSKLNQEQRKEFVELFTRLLERVYTDKILAYTNQKIVFTKENMFSDKRAEVCSDVISDTRAFSIHYRMMLKNGEWKVYDVVIEGVSLIENYRSQFKRILTKKPPEELLRILREKVVAA